MLINTRRALSYFGTCAMSLAFGVCIGGLLEKFKDNDDLVIDEI